MTDDQLANHVLHLIQDIARALRHYPPVETPTLINLDYERYVEQPRREHLNKHKAAS